MFRAVSLVLVLLMLLCSCYKTPGTDTAPLLQPSPETTETQKQQKTWEETDEFLVLNLNDKATSIYDINGNLLKTIYTLCYDDGYYTKDNILKFYFRQSNGSMALRVFSFETGDFTTDEIPIDELNVYKKHYMILNDKQSWDLYSNTGEFLENISEKQYGEDYFENKYKESRDKELRVYKNYYLIEKNNHSWDVYSTDGNFLENIPGKQDATEDGLYYWFDDEYFNSKYQVGNEYSYYNSYYDCDYKTAEEIRKKVGLNGNEGIYDFNDYFAVIKNWSGEYILFCFYLNNFVDLDISGGYKVDNISVVKGTNYAIVNFFDAIENNYDRSYSQVIDMFGNTRFTTSIGNNCTLRDFGNNFIYLNRGNYRGIAYMGGDWIVKAVNDRRYSEDKEEYYGETSREDFLDEQALEALVSESSQRNFLREELINLSQYELSVLRNGVFALSGKIFTKNMEIKEYFESKEWYNGISADDKTIREKFNKYQAANLSLIEQIEKEKGYR